MYTSISEKKNSITKLLASSTTQQGSKQKKKEKKNELHQFLCFNIVQSWTISRNTAILKTTGGKSNEGVKEGMDKNLAISSGKKAIILMALVPSPFIATTVQTSKREEKGRERERGVEQYRTIHDGLWRDEILRLKMKKDLKVFSISPPAARYVKRKKANSSLSLSLLKGVEKWKRTKLLFFSRSTVFRTLCQKRNGKGTIVEEESFEKESFFSFHL